jgi:hypothetical protein
VAVVVDPEQAPPLHTPVAQGQGVPHCPFAAHVSTLLPEHRVAFGAQTPVHTPSTHA